MYASRSSSEVASLPGSAVPRIESLKTGAEYNRRALLIASLIIAISTFSSSNLKSILG
jgi:hypothetical protein